ISGDGGWKAPIFDVETGKKVAQFQGQNAVAFAAADGSTVITDGPDRALRLWDVATSKEIRRFGPIDRPVCCLALSAGPSPIIAAVAGETGKEYAVHLWDLNSGTALGRLGGQMHRIF